MMWSLPLNMESVLWSRQLLNWGWSRAGRKVRVVREDVKGESTGEKRRVSLHTGPEAPKGCFEEASQFPLAAWRMFLSVLPLSVLSMIHVQVFVMSHLDAARAY